MLSPCWWHGSGDDKQERAKKNVPRITIAVTWSIAEAAHVDLDKEEKEKEEMIRSGHPSMRMLAKKPGSRSPVCPPWYSTSRLRWGISRWFVQVAGCVSSAPTRGGQSRPALSLAGCKDRALAGYKGRAGHPMSEVACPEQFVGVMTQGK